MREALVVGRQAGMSVASTAAALEKATEGAEAKYKNPFGFNRRARRAMIAELRREAKRERGNGYE